MQAWVAIVRFEIIDQAETLTLRNEGDGAVSFRRTMLSPRLSLWLLVPLLLAVVMAYFGVG